MSTNTAKVATQETSLSVRGDIIRAMYDTASETLGHTATWVSESIEFRESFTHMGMNVQINYTIDDIMSRLINEDPLRTKVKVAHPDLNLNRNWARSGLGCQNSTLNTLCEALQVSAGLYQAVKEAGFMVACDGTDPVVMGPRSEMHDLTVTSETINVTPDEESFTAAGVREVDKSLVAHLSKALHEYASECNLSVNLPVHVRLAI